MTGKALAYPVAPGPGHPEQDVDLHASAALPEWLVVRPAVAQEPERTVRRLSAGL